MDSPRVPRRWWDTWSRRRSRLVWVWRRPCSRGDERMRMETWTPKSPGEFRELPEEKPNRSSWRDSTKLRWVQPRTGYRDRSLTSQLLFLSWLWDGELNSNLLTLFQIKAGLFPQVDCFGIKAFKLSGLRPPVMSLSPPDDRHWSSIIWSGWVQFRITCRMTSPKPFNQTLLSLRWFVKAELI